MILPWTSHSTSGLFLVLFSALAFLRDCFPSTSISEDQNLAPYWSLIGFLPLSYSPVSNIHCSIPTHRAGNKTNPSLCLLPTPNIPLSLSLAKASLALTTYWWSVWKYLLLPNIYGFFFSHVLLTLWLPALNKRAFFSQCFGVVMFFSLPNAVLINPREKNPSKSIFVTATVYLEIVNDVITWVQSLLKMSAFPESHGKQLIGDHVYAFNYLQLLYTTCCSRNNNFIICNKTNWSGRVFMHQHTPFHLCYPLNIGTGLVFLTCELPVNPLVLCLWTGLPWSMGLSNTTEEKGESTSGEDCAIWCSAQYCWLKNSGLHGGQEIYLS